QDIRTCFDLKEGPYSVHRLDKGTTGCLVVPMNHKTAKSLSSQFQQEDKIRKTYLALVRGGSRTFTSSHGSISEPILYEDGRGIINPEGKRSLTKWELVGSSPKSPVSLLKLTLVTGNKHQLRIHLAKSLGAPVLGDILYSSKALHPSIIEHSKIPEGRVFLHASSIAFQRHAKDTGRQYEMEVYAPLPSDFWTICQNLEIPLPDQRWVNGAVINDNDEAVLLQHNIQRKHAT
ncbi:pseudouridine synthase, partial [Panaeolus papilionaceus]